MAESGVKGYERKRAPIACEHCRLKKRRCDGKTPCKNCEENNADCIYTGRKTQRFHVDELIHDKLAKIEEILVNHDDLLMALVVQTKEKEFASPVSNSSVSGRKNSYVSNDGSTILNEESDLAMIEAGNLPPLTIPTGHNTATIRVLRLPQVKALIGEYPRDYFYDIEARRKIPGLDNVNNQPYFDRDTCDVLIESFRNTAHGHRPILDYNTLLNYYKDFFEDGFSWSIENAIVLVALALGEVATSDYTKFQPSDNPDWTIPGMSYFAVAFDIISKLGSIDLGNNIVLVQAQALASIYFAYIAYPLYSWRLIHSASTTIELLLSRSNNGTPNDDKIKLFWCCFLTESDRLAEFELPRTRVGAMVDDMVLPSVLAPEDSIIIYFLAEISIRRLLNRVHNTLYTDDSDAKSKSIKTLLIISNELNRQLETWHESIPETFRPTLGMDAPESLTEREIILRVRYYACRHIIFRPFVLRVISNPEDDYSPQILENCAKCISSIRMYIHNVGYVLSRSSSYTWTLGMSSLGAVLVITAASQSPLLQAYLPDVLELQNIVLKNLLPWAFPGSSIQSITWILEHIIHKQQFNFN